MKKTPLHINKMSLSDAHEISNWKYEYPYEMYSMDGSPETIQSLLSEEYYAVISDKDLFGYFCLGKEARVPGGYHIGLYDDDAYVDLGLGMP
ncbi:hypothetical protein [Salipaludibacillus sp. CF4.18]|uniref:hypothetical protein n=1 Tax=Salipaludibacillus sp. CF4.18 TaxID=3373081 RepID=UPI003EE5B636